MSGGRYVDSSGRLVTRLTAYHISRHVASTFKRLTTATAHCDLNQNHQLRRGIISILILHIKPICHPYSDYRNISITIPISSRVTGNHSTSTGPISVAAIRTQVLVFSTLVPRKMQLGFPIQLLRI
jgi:hypothetical protein